MSCHFAAKDGYGDMLKEDIKFMSYYKKGIKYVLTKVCWFDENQHKELIHEAEAMNKLIELNISS